MVELVDAADSKSAGLMPLRVRVSPPVPIEIPKDPEGQKQAFRIFFVMVPNVL